MPPRSTGPRGGRSGSREPQRAGRVARTQTRAGRSSSPPGSAASREQRAKVVQELEQLQKEADVIRNKELPRMHQELERLLNEEEDAEKEIAALAEKLDAKKAFWREENGVKGVELKQVLHELERVTKAAEIVAKEQMEMDLQLREKKYESLEHKTNPKALRRAMGLVGDVTGSNREGLGGPSIMSRAGYSFQNPHRRGGSGARAGSNESRGSDGNSGSNAANPNHIATSGPVRPPISTSSRNASKQMQNLIYTGPPESTETISAGARRMIAATAQGRASITRNKAPPAVSRRTRGVLSGRDRLQRAAAQPRVRFLPSSRGGTPGAVLTGGGVRANINNMGSSSLPSEDHQLHDLVTASAAGGAFYKEPPGGSSSTASASSATWNGASVGSLQSSKTSSLAAAAMGRNSKTHQLRSDGFFRNAEVATYADVDADKNSCKNSNSTSSAPAAAMGPQMRGHPRTAPLGNRGSMPSDGSPELTTTYTFSREDPSASRQEGGGAAAAAGEAISTVESKNAAMAGAMQARSVWLSKQAQRDIKSIAESLQMLHDVDPSLTAPLEQIMRKPPNAGGMR